MGLRTIYHYYDVMAAQVAASHLRSEGIEAYVNGIHMASMDYGMILAMGGLALQVDQADAWKAIQIIDEAEKNITERCTSCGSAKVWKEIGAARGGVIAFITLLFGGGTQTPRSTDARRCLECDHRWRVQEDS